MKQSITASILCFLPLFWSATFASAEQAADQPNTAEIIVSQKVAVLVDKAAKLMALAQSESEKSENEEAIATCKLAIEACDEALSLASDDVPANNKKGAILMLSAAEREGMLQHDASIASCKQAVEVFDRVIAKDQDNMQAYTGKGLALEVLAKSQDMMSQPVDALASHRMSISCMDQVLKRAPNNTRAYICKGNSFMACGLLQKQSEPKVAIASYTEAIEAFDKAIKSAPDAIMTYQDKAEALRVRAKSEADMGQKNEALDSIKLCISTYDQAILHAKKPGSLAANRQSAVNFLKALQAGNVLSIEEIKRRLQAPDY